MRKTNKLMKLTLHDGMGERVIVSSIADAYEPEQPDRQKDRRARQPQTPTNSATSIPTECCLPPPIRTASATSCSPQTRGDRQPGPLNPPARKMFILLTRRRFHTIIESTNRHCLSNTISVPQGAERSEDEKNSCHGYGVYDDAHRSDCCPPVQTLRGRAASNRTAPSAGTTRNPPGTNCPPRFPTSKTDQVVGDTQSADWALHLGASLEAGFSFTVGEGESALTGSGKADLEAALSLEKNEDNTSADLCGALRNHQRGESHSSPATTGNPSHIPQRAALMSTPQVRRMPILLSRAARTN